jgi:anthranilate synthase component 2
MPGNVVMMKNDEIDFKQLKNADLLVISPGPDLPSVAGETLTVLKEFYKNLPILGICLGHQAIYEFFGGKLLQVDQVFHGIQTEILITKKVNVLFQDISNPFMAGRYHSWLADESSLPDELIITSTDTEKNIMSVEHKDYPIFGVQFHPESIMSPEGMKIIDNFVKHAINIKKQKLGA